MVTRLVRLACGAVLGLAAWGAQAAPAYSVLSSVPPDIGQVTQPLTAGPDGLLYGATNFSFVDPLGTVYRVDAGGAVTVLHIFQGSDGIGPSVPLVLGDDGWLYGATSGGGAGNQGVIFKVSPAGDFAIVHTFRAHVDQGLGSPHADLVPDGSGGLYGVGVAGSARDDVLYRLAADGTVTLIHAFSGPRLGRNVVNLTRTADGTLVGTTSLSPGGGFDGSLFSYRPGGRLHTVRSFDAATDGSFPSGRLAIGRDGAVYGALAQGTPTGFGSIWRLGRDGAFSLIHTFDPNNGDVLGGGPYGGVSANASGYLYGTTGAAGKYFGGTAFSMSVTGTSHLLYAFDVRGDGGQGCANGCYPDLAPTWLPDGSLWSATQQGGDSNFGVFYRIVPKP